MGREGWRTRFSGVLLLGTILAVSAHAQTPPIQPQTPTITIPPAVTLPTVAPDEERLGQPLTANEAVAIALRRQPEVAFAAAGVRAAQGRTRQSRSNLGPQLSLNGGVNESRNFQGGSGSVGGANRYSASVGLDQLLFDFGRTRDQVRQTAALERASAEAFGRANQDVALAVRQAFYTYQESVRLREASEENLANRQRQLDLAQARLDAGFGAPGDVVRARTGLADAVIALTNARQSASFARVDLAAALGIDPRTPLNPAPSTEPEPPIDLSPLVETAMNDRPEIREARERVAAARAGVSVADKTNLPSFRISAGLATRGANDPFENSSGTVGVGVTWFFGDSGLTSGRRTEARALEDQARANLQAITNDVVSEISRAYVTLLSAQQRVTTSEEQLANARELVRIAEGRFAGGLGTFLEVTDAQTSLFNAQRTLVTAQNDVQRARAALRRSAGLSVR